MSARDLFATLTSASTTDDKANRDALDSLLALGSMGIPMLDVQARSTLTRKQLSDLSPTKTIESRLAHLKVLKELSRLPGGSNVQAEVQGLKALLGQVHLPSPAPAYRRPSTISQASTSSAGATAVGPSSLSGVLSRAWSGRKSKDNNSSEDSARLATPSPTLLRSPSPSSSSPVELADSPAPTPEEWEATDIALRCLNNALFLHETSRRTFTDDSVGGGARKIIGLLKVSHLAACMRCRRHQLTSCHSLRTRLPPQSTSSSSPAVSSSTRPSLSQTSIVAQSRRKASCSTCARP